MSQLVQEAEKRLQKQGGRMTGQRRLIMETLESLAVDQHPTADELYEYVQVEDPSLHLSTVYRTLRWMEGEGLVIARRFKEDCRQERFDPVLPSEHHHFLCTRCKRVIEFTTPLSETIKSHFSQEFGPYVETVSVMLYGVCEKCQQEEEAI